jgi:hypothetical protein
VTHEIESILVILALPNWELLWQRASNDIPAIRPYLTRTVVGRQPLRRRSQLHDRLVGPAGLEPATNGL